MARKPQRFFGVYQDITSLKVATLQLEGRNQLRVIGLDQIDLPEAEDTVGAEYLDAFDFSGEGGPEAGAFDSLLESEDALPDGLPQEGEEIDDTPPTRQELIKAITEELGMHDGAIALNLDVFNVGYRRIPVLPGAKKKSILMDVRASMASEASAFAVYQHFPLDEDSVIGVSYQGSMDLLETMLETSQRFPKRYFRISHIQTDEMALINALRMHYNLEAHEVSAIFYIGREYSRVTIVQGGSFIAALPIFNEGSDTDNIITKVHSRFLLDRLQHRIPELDRVFVAGDGVDSEMLDYLRGAESQAQVELLSPLIFPVELGRDTTPEEVSSYIIPIMLATVAAFPKDPALVNANFTPRKLLERQNILSMGVPGVMILAAFVGVLYLSLDNASALAAQNRALDLENRDLERRIAQNMARIDSIRALEAEVAAFEQKNYYVRQLIGDNNQWRHILKDLSNCFQDRPLTWATNVHRIADGFKLEGETTDRQYVLAISQLFPNARIDEVSEGDIQGYTVWKYNIEATMPSAQKMRERESGPPRNKFGVRTDDTPEMADPDTKLRMVRENGLHRVASGETLSSLAREYGATVEDLKRLNDLQDETIYIGQTLKVPGKDAPPAELRTYSPQTAPDLAPAQYETYEVKDGDNLFRVALRFKTTVEEIRRVNGLETEVIYTGQKLKIPR